MRSEGKCEAKRNDAPYHSLSDRKEAIKEAIPPSSMADAVDLEQVGFAELFEDDLAKEA